MAFVVKKHPVLLVPTAAEAAAMGEAAWLELMNRRKEEIRKEEEDPLRYGWEPDVWHLADALLDQDVGDPAWRRRVRTALGFERPAKVLLINGGNRGSKTEYACKRLMRLLAAKSGAVTWTFHSTSQMSVEAHHALFWKFMPPALRHNVRGEVEYIAYKQKTGFSEHKFVLPNGSMGVFKFYAMEKDDALQGPEIDAFEADEMVGPDWVTDLQMRIATRDGWGIVSFTPKQGYSATVREFQDGAKTVLWSTGFLLPKDGGEPDVARALGFGSEEEMRRAHAEERWSEPSRFELRPAAEKKTTKGTEETRAPVRRLAAATGGTGGETEELVEIQPAAPAGRTFERVPRVLKCVDPTRAVLFFHSSDNPFGNPKNVVEALPKKNVEETKKLFYGVASKTISVRFPKFSRTVHVVPAGAIPAEGTNYHFVDPASGRNFFMLWFRCTKERTYIVREWPGSYEIPGIGVPGPWAMPDGRRPDGRPGPAQRPFGFGLRDYKKEIARLEGWPDYAEAAGGGRAPPGEPDYAAAAGGAQEAQDGTRAPVRRLAAATGGTRGEREEHRRKPVAEWTDLKARERILDRWLDSRAASSPRVENDRPRTLLTDFEELGMFFRLTPGDEIEEGAEMITDALAWDENAPLDFFNQPKLYVNAECTNTIYALETWTGKTATGETDLRGASKDPIDLIRYAMLAEIEYVSADYWQTRGGGHY